MFPTDYDAPHKRKGSHWVPVLIMTLLFAVGTVLFFVLPYGSPAPENSVAVDDGMPWFRIENGTLSFSSDDYNGGSELTVPSSVAGQQVLALSEGCFENCTGLTAVHLPETLQAIGADAFRGCTALRGMDIPESVRFVGTGAFQGCSTMEAVHLSSSTEVIGTGAFTGCKALRYVFFSGLFEEWQELYGEFIAEDTTVSCDDGIFLQPRNRD